eukprot:365596-Chlamydomonas_euryale.AAC.29
MAARRRASGSRGAQPGAARRGGAQLAARNARTCSSRLTRLQQSAMRPRPLAGASRALLDGPGHAPLAPRVGARASAASRPISASLGGRSAHTSQPARPNGFGPETLGPRPGLLRMRMTHLGFRDPHRVRRARVGRVPRARAAPATIPRLPGRSGKVLCPKSVRAHQGRSLSDCHPSLGADAAPPPVLPDGTAQCP